MKKILAIATALILTACQNAPSGFESRPFAFELDRMAPLRIHVGEIKIIDNYQPPLRAPNVEQDFAISPANAVRKWADHRLQKTGNTGVLEIIIDDASVKETRLRKRQGVKGLFTDDQDARYDAKLAVTFRIFGGTRAISDATGDVLVSRSRSINEQATVNERQKIYHQMASEMMLQFDREAQARLRQYFSTYLK